MNYAIESLAGLERQITVAVPAEAVNATLDSLVAAKRKTFSLDGFRKGKVPLQIVEEHFGVEIYSQACEEIIQKRLSGILEREDLHPVSSFRFEGASNFKIARNTDFVFTCSFEVMPKIDLPVFSELSVEIEDVEVLGSAIKRLTRNMLRRFGKLAEVMEERSPRDGDIVLVDVQTFSEGKHFIGLHFQNKYMQINDGDNLPELEKVICGLTRNKEGKGVFVCPDDYVDPSLRGKPVVFTVALHGIFEEKLPDLDDELAQKMGHKNANALKKFIFEYELNASLKKIKGKGEQRLLKSVLDTLDFPLPHSMLKKEVDSYLAATRKLLGKNGISQSETEEILEAIQDEAVQNARERVKAQCFLMAVSYRENIKVYEKDADLAIKNMARESGQDYQEFRAHFMKSGAVHDLQERLMAEKALLFMYEQARKIVVDKNGNPLTAPKAVFAEQAVPW